jgi:hypothetical protein
MRLDALRNAGAVISAAPALDPAMDDLRRRFSPSYDRLRSIGDDIAAGVRDVDGTSVSAAMRQERRGHYNAGLQCWDCHKFGVPSAVGRCPHCGYSHGGANHRAAATR